MADSVIDFAGIDSAAAGVDTNVETPETTGVETPTPEIEVNTEVAEEGKETPAAEEGKEKPEVGEDGKEKVEETDVTPQGIRTLLKQLKSDPKNAGAVKELHNAYERWTAAKQVFGSVQEMRDAKSFLETIGGPEGYEKMQSTLANVEESDGLLYAGDPKLISNIVEDLKAEGKIDALGKLAPSFLDAVKANDPDNYYKAFSSHFYAGLEQVNMPGAIGSLLKALGSVDPESLKENPTLARYISDAKEVAQGMKDWYDGLKAQQEQAKKSELDPERKKLQEERVKFQNEQKEFQTKQTKEFQDKVATEADHDNNRMLGSELKSYLKMPFFKSFKRENLIPLGNSIKQELYDRLKADTTYQAQMKAMWAGKNPDREKILQYHRTKVESLAAEVVRSTVQRIYPGYSKGGAAAGRVAAREVKKEVETKQVQQSQQTGKPIYVAVKPKWDAIDWDRDPKQLLYIAGRAYLKGGKLVTWRK